MTLNQSTGQIQTKHSVPIVQNYGTMYGTTLHSVGTWDLLRDFYTPTYTLFLNNLFLSVPLVAINQ